MYIFVWIDGTTRQVEENVTVADIMAVRMGTLKILRLKEKNLEQLMPDNETIHWVPVKSARSVSHKEYKFHIP